MIDGLMDRQIDVLMDRWIDRQIDRYREMVRWLDGLMD